jgi:uncharacterized membrane protein
MDSAEEILVAFINWVEMAAEFVAAVTIAIGIVSVVYRAIVDRVLGSPLAISGQSFRSTRLLFSHYLVLALEYQLAADILATAVAPSWDQLGKLAVIAVIRTFLNYFLGREMAEVEREAGAASTSASTE